MISEGMKLFEETVKNAAIEEREKAAKMAKLLTNMAEALQLLAETQLEVIELGLNDKINCMEGGQAILKNMGLLHKELFGE